MELEWFLGRKTLDNNNNFRDILETVLTEYRKNI